MASHFGNPYLFTGRELDSETGLYNYRGRYYDVPLSRFINKDPVGYKGGDTNLCRYVFDNPTTNTDSTGLLIDLDVPMTPTKCGILASLMDEVYAIGPSRDLWLYWKAGSGKPREVPFWWFDFGRFGRMGAEDDLIHLMGSTGMGAKCGQTIIDDCSEPKPSRSNMTSYHVYMIAGYQFWWECTYGAKKHCDKQGNCTYIEAWGKCTFHAQDTVDFWPAPYEGFMAPPYWVHDRLVRACYPGGKGFVISASETVKYDLTLDCAGGVNTITKW